MIEVVEIDEIDYQLHLLNLIQMPPVKVHGTEFTYKAAAILKNGNLVIVFVPPQEVENE